MTAALVDLAQPAAPPPLYGTKRNPALPTAGPRIGVVAEALGTPLMPWQALVSDVAGEYLPSGAWRYPLVIVTVPRQAGKTTLVRAVSVERGLSRPGRKIFLTAQTGKDAAQRWKDLVAGVESSPIGSRCTVYRGAAAPTLHLPNLSLIRSFAPTPKAMHGETPHMVGIDEAWAFDEAQGSDLMAAIRPAQITLIDKQLWIFSTAGTAESAMLKDLVDQGRLATQDPNAQIAYFEWSLAEGLDPYDQANWAFHPALGHTITLESLAAEAAANTRGNWERSFMNRWTTTDEPLLDMAAWDSLKIEDQEPPDPSQVTISFEVARDRSAASIWAAWADAEGTAHLAAWRSEMGISWLTADLAQFAAAGYRITADDYGPNRPYIRALEDDGHQVTILKAREFADACHLFRAAAEDRTLVHDGSPNLRNAILAAKTRNLGGDGATAWSRKDSITVIDPLGAATVALHQALTNTTNTLQIY